MTIEEQVYAALSGHAPLTALVNTSITNGEMQQSGSFPQVTFSFIARTGTQQMSGTVPAYMTRVSLRCAAYSNAGVQAVRDAVHAVMIAFRGDAFPNAPTMFIGEYSMTDPYNTPKLRVRTLDYYVWTAVLE